MTQTAADAIRAAKHRTQWGVWATHRFLQKRRVPYVLYSLARNLELGVM